MWSLGSSPLWEYVQPSLEATKTCIICSALCRGIPAAPLFVVLNLAPTSFSWCPSSACPVRKVDNQSLPTLPTLGHSSEGFFVYWKVTSFTDCCVLLHWFVPCTVAFSTFDLLSCLSLNICQFCCKPSEGFSCSVAYDSSAILHGWC